ncbi:MAG: metalloregulator ArsR/SmtB family transcription factor [Proteobacteria bacterium]|nr:metalloregulator ArsR/SmtB family transcription factor [Pseudomonadota bacterium]
MEQLTQMYKALSEDMRLRVVMLLTHGEICVCDLMAIFGESQSKVSRHLAYLKHSGLVKSKRVGTWMHYSLKEPLDSTIDAQVTFMKQQLSQLPVFLRDEEKMQDIKKQKLCEEDIKDGRRASQ